MGTRSNIGGIVKNGMITNKYGSKRWYVNDILHREDGPAIEFANGDKVWFINGKRHREDGPAFEYADGDKEWYLYNHHVTEEIVMDPGKRKEWELEQVLEAL